MAKSLPESFTAYAAFVNQRRLASHFSATGLNSEGAPPVVTLHEKAAECLNYSLMMQLRAGLDPTLSWEGEGGSVHPELGYQLPEIFAQPCELVAGVGGLADSR